MFALDSKTAGQRAPDIRVSSSSFGSLDFGSLTEQLQAISSQLEALSTSQTRFDTAVRSLDSNLAKVMTRQEHHHAALLDTIIAVHVHSKGASVDDSSPKVSSSHNRTSSLSSDTQSVRDPTSSSSPSSASSAKHVRSSKTRKGVQDKRGSATSNQSRHHTADSNPAWAPLASVVKIVTDICEVQDVRCHPLTPHAEEEEHHHAALRDTIIAVHVHSKGASVDDSSPKVSVDGSSPKAYVADHSCSESGPASPKASTAEKRHSARTNSSGVHSRRQGSKHSDVATSPAARTALWTTLRKNRRAHTGSSTASEKSDHTQGSPQRQRLYDASTVFPRCAHRHRAALIGSSHRSPRTSGVSAPQSNEEAPKSNEEAPQAAGMSPILSQQYLEGPETIPANNFLMRSRLSLGGNQSTWVTNQTSVRGLAGYMERFVLIPGSCQLFLLDVVMVCAVLLTGIAVPIGLAYLTRDSFSSGPLAAALCIVDVLWIIGIAANFLTAFIELGVMVTNLPRIAYRYTCTWLVCDLLAAWPLMLATGDGTFSTVLQLTSLLRLLRLCRLFARMQNAFATGILYPVAVVMVTTLVCNVLSCGWRAVQDGSSSGLEPEKPWFDLFVKDVYFIMTTMSGVGYGDIHAVGTAQHLYAILAMCIAPLVFGAVITLLSHASEGLFNDKIAIQVATAVDFMKRRGVRPELQRRVQDNLRLNALQEQQVMMTPDLLAQLSPTMQRELLSELLRSTVLQFPLFKDASSAFIGEIAQAHAWVQCLPGDVVVEEGQLIQEMVFIIKGKVIIQGGGGSVSSQDGHYIAGSDQVENDARAGAWFGESSLFESERTRDFSVVAVLESELAVLEAASYHGIVSKYPRLLARHQQIVADLNTGKLSRSMFLYCKPVEIGVRHNRQHNHGKFTRALRRMVAHDTRSIVPSTS